jgi:hypothetical protein
MFVQRWAFQDLRIIDLPRQTHMHICERFITIHNDLGNNTLNLPRLENNNNKPRQWRFYLQIFYL